MALLLDESGTHGSLLRLQMSRSAPDRYSLHAKGVAPRLARRAIARKIR